jgi:hypothetical protein
MTRDVALQALAAAMRAEEEARTAVRHAMADQARLLAQLRILGVPATAVAHRLGTARGVALPIQERLRLARRMRKRAQRETRRRAELGRLPGSPAVAGSPSSRRALMPVNQEGNAMAKLVKRVITEEYIDNRDLGDLDEDREEEADDQEGEDGDSDEEREHKRRR